MENLDKPCMTTKQGKSGDIKEKIYTKESLFIPS